MKFGFFGGAILLILTLIFSYIAIQNNKMAREITINAFDLKQPQQVTVQNTNQKGEDPAKSQDVNIQGDKNNTETTEPQVSKAEVKAQSKWDKFDEKFKDFDKKFEKF